MSTHGIAYPPDLVLADNHILHRLSPSQFSSLHLSHLLAHPPDHVLFPFLHGLEGKNHAQNLFFASNGQPVHAPDYRGLVWVLCEDDLDHHHPPPPTHPPQPMPEAEDESSE